MAARSSALALSAALAMTSDPAESRCALMAGPRARYCHGRAAVNIACRRALSQQSNQARKRHRAAAVFMFRATAANSASSSLRALNSTYGTNSVSLSFLGSFCIL
jgi:hypothetical protein